MSATWQSLLVRIGERCAEYGGHADAEDHIETCYTYLLREVQQQHGNEIVTLLMQCVEELPHKDPLYGTLVGLLNLGHGVRCQNREADTCRNTDGIGYR